MYIAIARELADVWLGFTTWRGPNLTLAQAARRKGTENFAIIAAAVLPWSTSIAGIFALAFLLAFLTTAKWPAFFRSLKHPASMAALAVCLVALLGLLWATDIPWSERLRGLTPIGKFLGIPLLIYYFGHSARRRYIFFAFAASCTVLMLYSWIVLVFPALAIHYKSDQPGIPVKNYIDQSQGFAFCVFALAAIAIEAYRKQQRAVAITAATIAAALAANLVFVNVARTALVYSPVIAAMFAYRYLSGKHFWIALVTLVLAVAGLWAVSPNLQQKTSAVFAEYKVRMTDRGPSSVGERLEYWNKSIRFIEAAPVLGHGTGSTKTLFQRDAVGKTGLSALVTGNPHNQTLLFAIQWGLVGCLALFAMWMTHLWIFRGGGLVAWIGLVGVVQNILSSLFNSHLSDFYQGWLYVLVVGIAASALHGAADTDKASPTPSPERMVFRSASA